MSTLVTQPATCLVSGERFCYVRIHVKGDGMTTVRLRLSRWMQARQVRDLAGAA